MTVGNPMLQSLFKGKTSNSIQLHFFFLLDVVDIFSTSPQLSVNLHENTEGEKSCRSVTGL